MAKNDPNEHLQQVLKDHPEWIDEARKALSGWEAGKKFLMPVIAMALKAAYERGLRERTAARPSRPTPTPPTATNTRVRRVR